MVRGRGIALVAVAVVGFGLFAGACDETARYGDDGGSTYDSADEIVDSTPEVTDEESSEPTLTPPPPAIELAAAVSADKITITLRGESLQGLELTIESKIDTSIRVVVNPATMFIPGACGTQSMVVIEKEVVTLEAEETVEVELEVACAEMHDETPTSDDAFRLASKRAPSDLVKLLKLPAFGDEAFRIQQFAIWTITDNPTRTGYVGLSSSDGSGGEPTTAELERIAGLFAEAGIPAGHYRALR
jgi:hypothetical protein